MRSAPPLQDHKIAFGIAMAKRGPWTRIDRSYPCWENSSRLGYMALSDRIIKAWNMFSLLLEEHDAEIDLNIKPSCSGERLASRVTNMAIAFGIAVARNNPTWAQRSTPAAALAAAGGDGWTTGLVDLDPRRWRRS